MLSLVNICDIFNLNNLIKEPTCYASNNKPLLDNAILTNSEMFPKQVEPATSAQD